jgi:hypothetical protein
MPVSRSKIPNLVDTFTCVKAGEHLQGPNGNNDGIFHDMTNVAYFRIPQRELELRCNSLLLRISCIYLLLSPKNEARCNVGGKRAAHSA